jgi:phosphohistidine phosphatase
MIAYFLRHASAGQHKSNPDKDERRPLDKDGIRQGHDVGRALAALDVQLDAVLSSPLKRATQTAALVANEIGYEGKLEIVDALRPEAAFSAFQALLRKHETQDAILVVGHNPSLSEILSLLVSAGTNKDAVELRKGAVAKVEVLGKRAATLQWCLTPKVVRVLYDVSSALNSAEKRRRK